MSFLTSGLMAAPSIASGGGLGGLLKGVTGKDILGFGSSVLGSAVSPAPTQATSGGGYLGSTVTTDHSGWTVSTGGGTAYGTPPALKATSVYMVAAVGAAVVLALLVWKRKG